MQLMWRCSLRFPRFGCIINSMKALYIKNGQIIGKDRIYPGSILIRNGRIERILEEPAGDRLSAAGGSHERCSEMTCSEAICSTDAAEILDAQGCYISPGFIELHAHGGGGYDFMDGTVEAFREITRIHLLNGTTTIVPTTVSSDFSQLLRLFEVYREAQPYCPTMYGLHLEGPYLSPAQKGAHKAEHLRLPSMEDAELLIREGKGILKRMTAAPELPGMQAFAERLLENGVSMSVGHSNASAEVALDAFAYGFSHVTHLYSATSTVHKEDQVVKAGVIEAAYLSDSATVELIGDGKHAAQHAMQLAVKIKGPENIALVSDALRPAGTDVTESWLGEKVPQNRVIIEDGVAKLPDRSFFAGSIATGGMLLQKGVSHYGLSLLDTVTMMTRTPAGILGLEDRGRLEEGCVADIVLFDASCRIRQVLLGGKCVGSA